MRLRSPQFDHEKLKAYQESLRFYAWCKPVLERLPKTWAVSSQLDRARASAALNLAEGNGKSSPADRCRFFEISRGSAVECACCLDLLRIKHSVSGTEWSAGREILHQAVALTVGLIRYHDAGRLGEDSPEYRIGSGEFDGNEIGERERE